MKNKFNNIFLVGLIPVFLVLFFLVFLAVGIFYGVYRSKPVLAQTPREKYVHICPKTEKIYVHDTIRIKVPVPCKKDHVQEESSPSVQEDPKDTNGTNP